MQKLESIGLEKAQAFARECADRLAPKGEGATVIALIGDLGAGKTTFAQTLARAFGITEEVTSPTFVLEKIYRLPSGSKFERLIHIDAYRLEGEEELPPLGWDEAVADRGNLILVEWADRIAAALPSGTEYIRLEHAPGETRTITWETK